MDDFAGVTLDDLYLVKTTFETNVCVYMLVESDEEDGKITAEVVRRSLCHYPDTLRLNLHEKHFSYIQVVRMYSHSYRCRNCGDSLWKYVYHLHKHDRTCKGGVRRVYPGGVYHSTPSMFERPDDENIRVSKSLRYYPCRATFNIECWFDTTKVHWVARHVPLSVPNTLLPVRVKDRGTTKRRQRERREIWYRVVFRHQTQQHFHVSTDQLKETTNYIAPGFSYDYYIAYGCEVTKSHFP